MRTIRPALPATLLALAVMQSLGCRDSTGPNTGTIAVTLSTGGASIDPDGYTLRIDDGSVQAVGVNGTVSFGDLPLGNHLVRLEGVEPNCSVNGSNPRSVDLSAKNATSPAKVTFTVFCLAKPGIIRISSTTTGSEQDPDGYLVRIYPLGFAAPELGTLTLPVNGTRDIPGLVSGQYSVTLFGVVGNCVVDGFTDRQVGVGPGTIVEVAFVIRCVQSGSIRVTAATTGVDIDADGYFVGLDREGVFTGAEVKANGAATFGKLRPGNYRMTLYGISANCDATMPNPREVTVVAGSVGPVTVDIKCEAPRQLALVVGYGAQANIYAVNSNGSGAAQLTLDPSADLDPAWSPDGKRIAFASLRDGNSEIYVMTATGTGQVRITNALAADYRPAWSPDGAKIAFVSERDGNREIYVMNADGTNPIRLTTDLALDADPAWSPNGSSIAFRSDRGGTTGIWVMNADGSGLRRLTSSVRPDRQPAWSPDGTRIAFSRAISANTREIFVMNADGSSVMQLTGGFEEAADPAWSPDGKKIAFGETSYYYGSDVVIVSVAGIPYAGLSPLTPTSKPTWRP